LIAAAAAPLAGARAAQEKPPAAPPVEAKPAPSPESPESTTEKKAKRSEEVGASQTRKPRYLKVIEAEFRAVDLDKKTLSFQMDDGKSYTVEAQVPGRPETVARAAKLAEVLKPGDRIRMLCRVNEKEEPTLILTLHMVGDTVPMQYR
jgi:hypothetical protein